ncbi:ISMca6, transposase, OrfB [Methylocaldum marinum]|uniref:ISMca6, transposase, OrfB n=1 Tax=Methylocaldum marinum TaxID=1432792 RepID=A0A250KQ42_9GAMM|nr:transposase family protein [Methylocaldum marinum]BBA33793.1 ISMca6, transposase, OrfB [Methylocaldum marinum]
MIATGSDLLVQLKGNHPKLHAAVRAVCQTQPHAEQAYTVDLGRRNRIEQRTARVWSLAVVKVRRRCFEPRQAPVADDLVTRDASMATLAEAIRGHWGIENRLHDVLDTALGEDASRIRKNPGMFAYLRHFVLNRLRHNGQSNIHATLYDNAMDLERVLSYKGIKR